ncbi:MAG: HlyD family efflux transporter periplasmic adaptor subunit [Oscillospiraceae bacterium]|nr:HlyD family efflux transporter periplasmic adaptor subunit [Oscillospiraceae bacterium]
MEEKRRRNNIILAVLLLAVATGMIMLPNLLRREEPEKQDSASILSAEVQRGDIRTTISGGGTLTEDEGTAVTIPKGVELTGYYVSEGELVTAGQPVARVDELSVRQLIITIQANLDHVARQMRYTTNTVGNNSVYAASAGRVKAIYAQMGEKAVDVMTRDGALALISLDGLMALELDSDADVSAGTAVTVRLPDGTTKPGRIEHRQGTRLTVTLSDEGPTPGDTAEVLTADGVSLGTGTLYVHSALKVTAYSGTVSYIGVKVERVVVAGTHLFNLKDSDFTTAFNDLAEKHREYEEAMVELYALLDNGVVTAPEDGRIFGLDKNVVRLARAGEDKPVLRLLDDGETAFDPNSASPGDYDNRYAQVAQVTFGSISFFVQKETSKVSEYTAYPTVKYSKTSEAVFRSFDNIPIFTYVKSSKSWQSIGPDDLYAGDVLWFVCQGDNLVGILRPPTPKPKVPKGSYGGGGGGGSDEDSFEAWELEDVEIGRIIDQKTLTVSVSIDELDILAVALGQSAEITVDALPGRAYTGTVREINPNGKNSGGNTRYTITIGLDRDENMLAGMNATAILTVGVTENVLTLPAAALNHKGNHTVVYTGYDAETKTLTDPVEITIGVSDSETVQVIDGLDEGDTVWYSYYEPDPRAGLFTGSGGDTI